MATRRPKLQVRPNISRRSQPGSAAPQQADPSAESSDPPAEKPELTKAAEDKTEVTPQSHPAGDEGKQVDSTEAMEQEEKKVEAASGPGRRRLIKPKVQLPGARKPRLPTGKDDNSSEKDKVTENTEQGISEEAKQTTKESKDEGNVGQMEEDGAARVVLQSPIKIPSDAIAVPAKDKPTSNEKSKETREQARVLSPPRSRFHKVVPNLSTERKR